jgi:hypothetical protein
MTAVTQTYNFANLVALFLAENIRSRKISLKRAAEISETVVLNLARLGSEEEVLQFLAEVERDFEEVITLKQVLHFGYAQTDIAMYEDEIKEYAARIFPEDMVLSAGFLQDAIKPEMTIQKLSLKYPDFCRFVFASGKKEYLIQTALNPAI